MLRINNFKAVKVLVLASLFAVLSSFSGNWGGDTYRVFVNNKLVLEEYVAVMKGAVKSVQLNQLAPNDEIAVYYSHCGVSGKARNISIRDGKNKVLKEWKFADSPDRTNTPMTCKAKDILPLQKDADRLNLYYSSKELPGGKMLAGISIGRENITHP
jgi:hypothetical protein